MTSLINVKDLYNDIATVTGFPQYTNATDTPDITRFILEVISESLLSTIDLLSTNTNTLERTDRIITIAGQDLYPVEGVVKHISWCLNNGVKKYRRLPYNNYVDVHQPTDKGAKKSSPVSYAIKDGYVRLYPVPDKEYELVVTLSSTDLVLSDNDVYKNTVTHIDDLIIGSKDFANLIKLRAIAFILVRCQSPNAQVYSEMARIRMRTYMEKDFTSNEATRLYRTDGGNYNSRRGLLD